MLQNKVQKQKWDAMERICVIYLILRSGFISRSNILEELGLESLQLRRWYRKLSTFFKLYKNESPKYLSKLIPVRNSLYTTRNAENIPLLKTDHAFFKNSFFPSTIIEWNKLDLNIRNAESFGVFKNSILKFIRPTPNSTFNCYNPKGLKYVTRLRLRLSHLREHKFKHCFEGLVNPFCLCGIDIESTSHYLLHCPTYNDERHTFLSSLKT